MLKTPKDRLPTPLELARETQLARDAHAKSLRALIVATDNLNFAKRTFKAAEIGVTLAQGSNLGSNDLTRKANLSTYVAHEQAALSAAEDEEAKARTEGDITKNRLAAANSLREIVALDIQLRQLAK